MNAPVSVSYYSSTESHEWLQDAIEQSCLRIPPLFDVRDMVAVNPFIGFADYDFLEASIAVEMLFHEEVLPAPSQQSPRGPRLLCVADRAVRLHGEVAETPLLSLCRFLGSYLETHEDSKLKAGALYKNFLRFASADASADSAGLSGYRSLAQSLPPTGPDLIAALIPELALNQVELGAYFTRLLARLPGYAGALRAEAFQKEDPKGSLPDLLAILMFQDFALSHLSGLTFEPEYLEGEQGFYEDRKERLAGLSLSESKLTAELSAQMKGSSSFEPVTPSSQLVFCIDVRSERYRRELEQSEDIETYGFAGFFGLPMAVRGEHGSRPHCPPLLEPTFTLKRNDGAKNGVLATGLSRGLKSAVSAFGFVEGWGASYLPKLVASTLNSKGPLLAPELSDVHLSPADSESLAKQAQAILKGIGLKFPLAPLVVLVGHDSRVENNLQKASLACGACAGHSGVPNAQVAAEILNHREVRNALQGTRYEIPEDVLVLAAEHETVTDTVTLIVPPRLSEKHSLSIAQLQSQLRTATHRSQLRRKGLSPEQGTDVSEYFLKATRDYAEVQPELGLAGNAAFLIGRRQLTRGAPLEGRAFLHSYDANMDKDNSTLEMILGGPAVVGSWINLQYYASTVAPRVFGSGHKTLHNLVGRYGVTEGGQGDLAVGLARESLITLDGSAHSPLRLHLMVETSVQRLVGAVGKVPALTALIAGGWVKLSAIEVSGGEVACHSVDPAVFQRGNESAVAAE